jgi:hypothetical protein
MKIGYIVALILYLRIIFIDENKLSTLLKIMIGFGIVFFILAIKFFKNKNGDEN